MKRYSRERGVSLGAEVLEQLGVRVGEQSLGRVEERLGERERIEPAQRTQRLGE